MLDLEADPHAEVRYHGRGVKVVARMGPFLEGWRCGPGRLAHMAVTPSTASGSMAARCESSCLNPGTTSQ